MWIARDKDGDLFVFEYKPELRMNSEWVPQNDKSSVYLTDLTNYIQLPKSMCPELKFENSPKKVKNILI